MKRLVQILAITCIVSVSILCGQEFHIFQPESFGKPFVSDIRSSIVKFEEGFVNDLGKFYFKPNYQHRPISEGHVGSDIPLFSYYKHFAGATFKSTFVLSGSFNIILDSLEPTTRMVINTDYWLGSEFRAVVYHPAFQTWKIRNLGFIITPLYHESTHIGDEFVMEAIQQDPTFYRVNVSYESWVLALTINDPDTLQGNVLSTRIALSGVWFPQDGFYQYDLNETQGQDLLLGEKCIEYWVQMNWRRTRGLLASSHFHQINSIEVRNRIKYGYEADNPEQRTWNINAYFGWEYQSKSDRKVGGYLRSYYGINPHGQFRDIGGFYFVGLSLVLM
jgi:hypothetical protein